MVSRLTRRGLLQATGGAAVAVAAGAFWRPAGRAASRRFAGANDIVRENRATPADTWTDAFRLNNGDGRLCGFATRTSVDRGEPLDLKVAMFDGDALGDTTANIGIFRLGHYDGHGGRLVHALTGVPLTSRSEPEPDGFGTVSCADWPVTATIPPSATEVSGVYLAKAISSDGKQSHIPFVVRDDDRPRDLLVVVPVSTWQAYNGWGGKSLYTYNSDARPTPAGVDPDGHARAVKVSFDRPYVNQIADFNWVLRTEFPLISWLERQGYDIAYTDDLSLHSQPEQLLPGATRTIVIAGHSEYWSAEAFEHVQAAVAAGTNLASFSANTAYWQVRYEDVHDGAPRTLVCFKTVQGTGTNGSGRASANDFGPRATARGGPHDPLGPDGRARTGDDRPRYATTTRRDNGAPPGDRDAPPEGRVGVGADGAGACENRLFGVLYIGDDDNGYYPLKVPAGAGRGGEFAGHPAWRHTSVTARGASIGTDLVGWEWDGIPGRNTRYWSSQPRGVKRVTETDPSSLSPPGSALEYIQDEGRRYAARPPSGQPPAVQAVTYRAPSGAHVFASGTIQWSWGLAPHFLQTAHSTYEEPPIDASDRRIQQATCNLLADGGVRPTTPEDVVLDPIARRRGRR